MTARPSGRTAGRPGSHRSCGRSSRSAREPTVGRGDLRPARLHLGVTRVLVGDLRAAGHLDVHLHDADALDPEIILRVIHGLRAIA